MAGLAWALVSAVRQSAAKMSSKVQLRNWRFLAWIANFWSSAGKWVGEKALAVPRLECRRDSNRG